VKTTRYMTKPCKHCGTTTSALVDEQAMRAAQMYGAFPKTQPKPAGLYMHAVGRFCLDCRGCGRALFALSVVGKVSHKHVCDAKCLASKGFKCECACGGKNHGASWA